jgi:hypothetical protein
VVAVERTDDTEEALLDGTLTAALSLLSSALPLTFFRSWWLSRARSIPAGHERFCYLLM